ncbi:MAG TPA: tetratricopeptide repeat protein [Vicinamibacterales bacterium]|nr:tetratricopeptide repeat protein [Vicinamibacterales bacterium]
MTFITRIAPVLAAVIVTAPLAAAAAADGPERTRTLVVPFDTGRDPRAYWLGEASAVLLADGLRALGADAISRDERIQAFERLQVPSVAALTHGTVIRIGQLVGASTVIVGSLRLDDEVLAVRARSIRIDTGRLEADVEERGPVAELFDLHRRLVSRLMPDAGTPLKKEEPPLAAFENYIKGLLAEAPETQAAFLTKAIDLHPGYDAARMALWRAHTAASRNEDALAAAEAVVARNPANEEAQFAAAYSEIQLARHEQAFKRLRALAERSPAAELLNNLGVIQLRRGSTPQTGTAAYWFSRATASDGGDADYFFNLGYAYWREDDGQAAIYWLREALRRDPTDADAHYVLSAALESAGHRSEARREFELAGRLSADYEHDSRRNLPPRERVPEGMERLKSTLDRGRHRIDAALFESLKREQRELVGFHLDRGRRLFEQERDSEAIQELRRVVYLSPYHAEAHLLLGRIYLKSGRTRDAVEALNISLWSSESVPAHVALAEAYLQANDAEAARRQLERALAMAPDSAEVQRLRSRIESPPR